MDLVWNQQSPRVLFRNHPASWNSKHLHGHRGDTCMATQERPACSHRRDLHGHTSGAVSPGLDIRKSKSVSSGPQDLDSWECPLSPPAKKRSGFANVHTYSHCKEGSPGDPPGQDDNGQIQPSGIKSDDWGQWAMFPFRSWFGIGGLRQTYAHPLPPVWVWLFWCAGLGE